MSISETRELVSVRPPNRYSAPRDRELLKRAVCKGLLAAAAVVACPTRLKEKTPEVADYVL